MVMSSLLNLIVVRELITNYTNLSQQFQALNDLLILESRSFAVFLEVSLSFIPLIRAQNDARRGFPTFFEGALRSLPGLAFS